MDFYKEYDARLFEAIRGAQCGMQANYQTIYQLSYQYIFKSVFDLVGERTIAEGLTQNAFQEIYRNLSFLSQPETYYVWAGRIVTDLVLSYIRSTNPTFCFSQNEEETSFRFEQVKEDIEAFIPESFLTDHEKLHILEMEISKLSIEQKICLQYFYYEEMSVFEIALKLSCSRSAVQKNLQEVRDILIKVIGEKNESDQSVGVYSLAAVPVFMLVLRYGLERFFAAGLVTAGVSAVGMGTGMVGTGSVGTGVAGTGVVGTGSVGTGVVGTGSVGTGAVGTGSGVAGTGAVGSGAAGTGTSMMGATGASASAGAASATAASATAAGATTSVATGAGAAVGVKLVVILTAAAITLGGVVNEVTTYIEDVQEENAYLEENPEDYLCNINGVPDNLYVTTSDDFSIESATETSGGRGSAYYPSAYEALSAAGITEDAIYALFDSVDTDEEKALYQKLEIVSEEYLSTLAQYRNAMDNEQYAAFKELVKPEFDRELCSAFYYATELMDLYELYGDEEPDMEEYSSLVGEAIATIDLKFEKYTYTISSDSMQALIQGIDVADIYDAYNSNANMNNVLFFYAMFSDISLVGEVEELQAYDLAVLECYGQIHDCCMDSNGFGNLYQSYLENRPESVYMTEVEEMYTK